MEELVRNLLLLALAGAAATFVGSAVAWWRDEPRRMRRMMQKALDASPEMMILAQDRGLAAGFNLAAGRVAVLWDEGAKGLVYRLDQLVGAELMLDDQVAARAYRDEQRRPLDATPSEVRRVMLRLVFDNAAHPDFELPLWPPANPARVQRKTAFDTIQEARRWVSSVEALLRKSAARTAVQPRAAAPEEPVLAAPPPTPDAATSQPPQTTGLPLFEAAALEEMDEEPPWDEEPEDDGR